MYYCGEHTSKDGLLHVLALNMSDMPLLSIYNKLKVNVV